MSAPASRPVDAFRVWVLRSGGPGAYAGRPAEDLAAARRAARRAVRAPGTETVEIHFGRFAGPAGAFVVKSILSV